MTRPTIDEKTYISYLEYELLLHRAYVGYALDHVEPDVALQDDRVYLLDPPQGVVEPASSAAVVVGWTPAFDLRGLVGVVMLEEPSPGRQAPPVQAYSSRELAEKERRVRAFRDFLATNMCGDQIVEATGRFAHENVHWTRKGRQRAFDLERELALHGALINNGLEPVKHDVVPPHGGVVDGWESNQWGARKLESASKKYSSKRLADLAQCVSERRGAAARVNLYVQENNMLSDEKAKGKKS